MCTACTIHLCTVNVLAARNWHYYSPGHTKGLKEMWMWIWMELPCGHSSSLPPPLRKLTLGAGQLIWNGCLAQGLTASFSLHWHPSLCPCSSPLSFGMKRSSGPLTLNLNLPLLDQFHLSVISSVKIHGYKRFFFAFPQHVLSLPCCITSVAKKDMICLHEFRLLVYIRLHRSHLVKMDIWYILNSWPQLSLFPYVNWNDVISFHSYCLRVSFFYLQSSHTTQPGISLCYLTDQLFCYLHHLPTNWIQKMSFIVQQRLEVDRWHEIFLIVIWLCLALVRQVITNLTANNNNLTWGAYHTWWPHTNVVEYECMIYSKFCTSIALPLNTKNV